MRGDEIDAGAGFAPVVTKQIARARESLGQLADPPAVPAPKGAHGVAESVVPLGPARGKPAQLIAPVAHVPGLRDQLDVRQGRLRADRLEEFRAFVEAVAFAPEHGGQIEAKAVHVHFLDPILEAFDDRGADLGMFAVDGIAAAGEVLVAALVLRQKTVVHRVVEALEADHRSRFAAFGGVIEHHVQDDLDAGPVKSLGHGLEFRDRVVDREFVARGEPRHGVVTPVVRRVRARAEKPRSANA